MYSVPARDRESFAFEVQCTSLARCTLSCDTLYFLLSKYNGDGEIRTLDPLLARQVLSQLSYAPVVIWQPPTFPYRYQYSIIGRLSLNHRVRDENGCFPKTHRHQKYAVIY